MGVERGIGATAVTAGGKGQLKQLPMAKLKKYAKAYNINVAGILEKDDFVDKLVATRVRLSHCLLLLPTVVLCFGKPLFLRGVSHRQTECWHLRRILDSPRMRLLPPWPLSWVQCQCPLLPCLWTYSLCPCPCPEFSPLWGEDNPDSIFSLS